MGGPKRQANHPLAFLLCALFDFHPRISLPIKPDLLLIYSNAGDTLQLVRLGSHSELFG
jgi:relE family toxin-antitoxin system, toxin component